MIIKTERLKLSELTIEDAPFILKLYNDPDFITYIGDRSIKSVKDAEQFIDLGPRTSYSKYSHGLYLVQLRDGTYVGICGLLKRDNLDYPDIGFAMLPKFRRKGYTFEAAKASINDGKMRLGIKTILAITSPKNIASIQLLNKLGMSFKKMVQMDSNSEFIHLYEV